MATSRLPPIHCLQAFEALARLRNVSAAAEELHVTPSAVSHRMKQLESQLGARLFGRSDFTLTADGAAYLTQVRSALASLSQLPWADERVAAPARRAKARSSTTWA